MSTEVHNLIARLKAMGATQAARELGKFANTVDDGTKSLSQMQLIGGVTAGMLVHDLARAFISATKEGIVMAGQLQTAETGFVRLTSRLEEGIISIESLRKATKGTVSDLDLFQTANKAVALGLPVERMNELFDIASKLGPLMGRTVTEAVNDLALGIGRQSRMILDNLGIVISAEEAYEEYAATVGKTASTLSKAERDQAFLNAAIAEGTRVTDEVGDAMSEQQQTILQATAAWENLKTTLGIILGTYVVLGGRIATSLQTATDATREHEMALEDLDDQVAHVAFTVETSFQEATEAIEDLADSAVTATRTAEEGFVLLASGAQISVDAFKALSEMVDEDYVDAINRANQETTDFFEESMKAYEALKEETEALKRTQLEEEFLDPLEDALDASRRKTDELNIEMMKLKRSLDLGTISQETYDAEAQRIRSTLDDLRIAQAELRLAIQDTTTALEVQGEAFAGLGETPAAGVGPFTFDFTRQAPLYTGVTGGGGQFQVMAMGGARGPTTTTSITINLTGEQIAGKTRAEIRELARQLAEEIAQETKIRGVP